MDLRLLLDKLIVSASEKSSDGRVSQIAKLQDGRDEGQPESKMTDPSLFVLREACTCNRCVNPTDHQRYFTWADIPTNLDITQVWRHDGDYVVEWRNDIQGYSDHVSYYKESQIALLAYSLSQPSKDILFGRSTKRLWRKSTLDMSASTVSYEEYMKNDAALVKLLYLVSRDGIAFIDGIPAKEDSVSKMAERIGPLRTTFYGETWDVKSIPNATNVAYTSRYLGFHMDMLYVREPPGLQFLHCIENTCRGGESRFADTFMAADRLITQHGQAPFFTLERTNVTYHYHRPGISTSSIKPVFDTLAHETKPLQIFVNAEHPDLVSRLHRVYWSPPFTGRALGNDGSNATANQLQASKQFHDILEDEDSFVKMKVSAGTCAVFDNFRVVHAREAFDLSSGKRWLRVAYVDDADFQSRIVSLQPEMQSVSECMDRDPLIKNDE